MDLILWRHADAADGIPDLERALTEKGLKQAARMGDFLLKRIPQDTRIIVSPAKRAQQTAQALGKYYTTEPAIAPNCSVNAVLQAANWPAGEGCVLIVGHQPVLGAVAGQLLCSNKSAFSVKKCAVWWLSHRQDFASETILRLVIAPELL
ncbi:MAG: SixA phosphatase family protein [Gallionellaceae bacterium]|jgi:phosphohistidine phosphatase